MYHLWHSAALAAGSMSLVRGMVIDQGQDEALWNPRGKHCFTTIGKLFALVHMQACVSFAMICPGWQSPSSVHRLTTCADLSRVQVFDSRGSNSSGAASEKSLNSLNHSGCGRVSLDHWVSR